MKGHAKRDRRLLLMGFLLLLCLMTAGAVLAETSVTPAADTVKVGEIIDFLVETDLKNATTCTYVLARGKKTVFEGSPETMFSTSYRAQLEGKYTLRVTVKEKGKKGTEETATCQFTVKGEAEPDQPGKDGLLVYSQKDGTWEKKNYRNSTLEKSGCAIFALSHALQLMGFDETRTRPEDLAVTYANCLVDGGTNNGKLIRLAGDDFCFTTEQELIYDQKRIRALLRAGCMFSFSVANGHIAMIAGISEGEDKVSVVDSAPSATFERIKKGWLYLEDGKGGFRKITDLSEIPGEHWFFETSGYGGARYWMDLSYAARRGVRLIRPAWVFLGNGDVASGGEPVTVESWGSAICTVTRGEEKRQIPSASLWWEHDTEALRVACVMNKNGAWLLNDEGKKVKKAEASALLPVIHMKDKQLRVRYHDELYWIDIRETELLDVSERIKTATVCLNGKINGNASVNTRFSASGKSKMMVRLRIGTKVAVTEEDGEFCRIETDGVSVWINREYLLFD